MAQMEDNTATKDPPLTTPPLTTLPLTMPAQSTVAATVRLAVYTSSLLGAYALLPRLFREGGVAFFKEGGLMEWLQFVMLGGMGLVFVADSVLFHRLRQWFVVLASFSLFACVRELDYFFDALLPWVGWQLPGLVVACVGVVTVLRNPRQFMRQAEEALPRRGFAILWAGFVVAVIFAQLVGHGKFLQELMGADYVRDYKRVIEELGELFGYALLVIGAAESTFEAPFSQRNLALRAAAARKSQSVETPGDL